MLRAEVYLDASESVEARVEDLLNRMTLSEKVGQMLQLDARSDLDDLVTYRLAGSMLHASPARMLEALELVQQTRLRIPILTADDCIHGHSFWPGATIFPRRKEVATPARPSRRKLRSWFLPPFERVARSDIRTFMPAIETVQAYVSDLVTSVTWAEHELKAFTQARVEPGESVTVTLEIPVAACTLVTADGRRVVEAGEFDLRVGPSSVAAAQLTARFRITG